MLSSVQKQSVIGRAVVCVLAVAAMERSLAAETEIGEVTVTATRVAAVSFDVPASISSVNADNFQNSSLGINLADDIAEVPGLLARNRNNYAQDQQVSIRGYGANSAFGIRGVRVYQDGIPASSPDGQGQISQFNLDSADRVEILRGPFSSLYGNSSGGVIQIFTKDGSDPFGIRLGVAYGSFRTVRESVNINDAEGAFSYNAGYTHFSTDGFRPHSEARSDSFNAKLAYEFNDANKLTLVGNMISRPDSEDTLGLTKAQFDANPRQTDAAAFNFNTRKSLQQEQAGLIYDLKPTESQTVRLLGYYGQREVIQYLSVATGAQTAATSAGGVIDLAREYAGGDARWSWEGSLGDKPVSVVAGVAYDRQNERRRGYNNFIGTTLGVRGPLRRDENNIVDNTDEYVQFSYEFAPMWSVLAGIRHSEVNFESDDHYVVPGNGNDSGETSYSATLPVAGIMFKPSDVFHAYASYGQGYQTPIVAELAYRASGGTGLNLGLNAARSKNAEVGFKIQAEGVSSEFAIFNANTDNEIVINTNTGGRSTYQNSGRTRRRGVETAFTFKMDDLVRAQFAYTYLDATYSDAYFTCTATPCVAATVRVDQGNRLPGIPEHNLFLSMRIGRDSGAHGGVNVQHVSNVAVNDTNSVFANSYGLFGVEGGYGIEGDHWKVNAFLRISNLFNKDYVGSIIVNDGNSRFFEPGAPRTLLGGATVTFK